MASVASDVTSWYCWRYSATVQNVIMLPISAQKLSSKSMAALFGLYVGATSASIAVIREGKTEVLANDAGDRVTPSVVAYKDGEALVGISALHQINQFPGGVICNAKHQIGEWEGDNVGNLNTCKPTVENGRSFYSIENNNGKANRISVTVNQVLTLIFKKLMETARSATGDANSHCAVLTVPTHFSAENRQVYRDAARAAGFNIVQVIKEPTASVLSYESELCYSKSDTNVVAVRVGGTSMAVTTFKITHGVYVITSSIARRGLAGHFITDLMVEHLMVEVQKRVGTEACYNARSRSKLRNAAENSKHVLSSLSTAQCLVESLYDGMDFQTSLTRARLDSIMSSFLTKFSALLEESLKQANLEGTDVDFVVLSGGSCRIPRVREAIQQVFPAAQQLGSVGPDEVIAVGAAIQASTLKEANNIGDECISVAVLGRGIYLKKMDTDGSPVMYCVFPRGPVMTSRKEIKVPLSPGQKSICLDVYEGDSSCEQNWQRATLIAKVVMKDLGSGAKLVAIFNIDSLTLKISLLEVGSQRKETVVIDNGS